MSGVTDFDLETLKRIVFEKLGIKNPVLLGSGGEGMVFEFGNVEIVKIFPKSPDLTYLHDLQVFQQILAKHSFTFATPEIVEIGDADGIIYTVEKRLRGIPMDKRLVGLGTNDRQKMYSSYYRAIKQIHTLQFLELPFGQLIKTSDSMTGSSWSEFLEKLLTLKLEKTRVRIAPLVDNFDQKLAQMRELITAELNCEEKKLVHRDYYLNNVLVGDDLEISAVLDFGAHTAVGDPRMDVASVLRWNEIDPNVKSEDYEFLYTQADFDYGIDIQHVADIYLLYSAFYFSDMADPSFSVRRLNDVDLWDRTAVVDA